MKRLYILLLLLLVCSAASAQKFSRRGIALGADRDTLLYIIASPFDNWYIHIQGGVQTFIGNELWASARHNKVNFSTSAEVGKWIIPDLSVGLRFWLCDVDGQSEYGRQPFIDKLNDTPNANGYYPFHAYAAGVLGIVTLDWTNFLNGYEAGRAHRWHVFTPIGLGATMLMGEQRNTAPQITDHEKGDFRCNFELAYTAGIGIEYTFSEHFSTSLIADLTGSESTWDWSPYDNSYSRFDLMPSVRLGMRFNLLKSITKYNPHTKTSSREKVNHEFLAFGSRNTISTLNGRIEQLGRQLDTALVSKERDSALIADLRDRLNQAQDERDSVIAEINSHPANVMADLLAQNELLNLPATIVYFKLDKHDLDYNGRKRLQNFAREVADMADTSEFYIIAAADSATGTPRHNQRLSGRRCNEVYNMLVKYCNMDANQLVRVPVGGITDYEPKENNRMAIVILRTPQTEAIIQRWLARKVEP